MWVDVQRKQIQPDLAQGPIAPDSTPTRRSAEHLRLYGGPKNRQLRPSGIVEEPTTSTSPHDARGSGVERHCLS